MQKGKNILLFFLILLSTNLLKAQYSERNRVSLDSLFEIADQRNRILKIADYNERIAVEQINEEKKKLLPSFDVSMSASYLGDGWLADRDFSGGMKAAIPAFGNNFALEASQIIYAGGAINTTIAIAGLQYQLASLAKEEDRQSIRFVIAGYYLELLKLKNQRHIMESNIAQTKILLEQIRAKYSQGTSLRNNTTRYELQLQSLELALLKLENNNTIINNELVKTLQLPQGTKLDVDDALVDRELALVSEKPWQGLATEYSPLLKQSQTQVKQAEKYEVLAMTEKLPQLFAFAADKLDGPITVEVPPLNKNLNYWYVGVGIKYNIALLYKSNSRISKAKLSTQKEQENSYRVKEQLVTDIEAARLRYLETIKVYDTQMKGVDLATQNYTITKNRYVNDLVLITEMLDAENAKVDAELQAANARINILFHYYQLKKLTGTL